MRAHAPKYKSEARCGRRPRLTKERNVTIGCAHTHRVLLTVGFLALSRVSPVRSAGLLRHKARSLRSTLQSLPRVSEQCDWSARYARHWRPMRRKRRALPRDSSPFPFLFPIV